MRRFLLFLLALSAAAQAPQPRIIRRGDDKNASQNLPAAKEPPAAVIADSARLAFQVSPLSNKGLLTPQMHDALKSIMRGGALVKVRAFVAGTGDLRRVQALLSEAYEGKKEPLPALSMVQVGALPLDGAQVLLEAVSEDKKAVNPSGVEFFSGTPEQMESAAGEVLRVTCFLNSLSGEPALRASLERKFPHAPLALMQALRDDAGQASTCEGVRKAASGAPGKLVFTGIQMAFGQQDADLKLAFERLGKTLEAQGSGYGDVVFSRVYALDGRVAARAAAIEPQFTKAARTPLLVENLPSIDAGLGIEAVASVRK